MKGQLVEVGERNKYHYNAPQYNLVKSVWNHDRSVQCFCELRSRQKSLTSRGDVSYDENNSSWEMAIGSQIYFKKMYSGIFLEPGLVRREVGNVFGPQILLGYTWFWDSGMNVSLAAGVGRNLNDSDDDTTDEWEDEDDTFGNGYFRVGYAF